MNTQIQCRQSNNYPIIIIVYLSCHLIWQETVRGDYSFVIFRVLFVFALAILAWRDNEIRKWYKEFLKIITPKGVSLPFVITILGATVCARLLVDLTIPHSKNIFGLMAFVNECIVAPASEEPVFRGLFLGILLLSKTPPKMAIVISALVFSSVHQVNGLIGYAPSFLGGVVYGYAFFKSRSLIPPMLAHAVWNFISFL